MENHSCATFLLSQPGHLLVGHNLDEYLPVPGLVFANPRGLAKHNIGWKDLQFFYSKSRPRVEWVSKYGSLTCNVFGREFPDGGMNEAGLYVGEMTLLGTVYPPGTGQPAIYDHQWIQYLLDQFATVEQVLADLGKVAVESHCQWHFFVADASGNAAVIEFARGQALVYTGADLPVKVLCNAAYAKELEKLRLQEGFEGSQPVDFSDHQGPARFAQAASMLQNAPAGLSAEAARGLAFDILEQLVCGNNKWRLVFDIPQRRLYYRTDLAPRIRTVALTSFNLEAGAPAMMLDIHQDKEGDTRADFQPFDAGLNRQFIQQAWQPIPLPFVLDKLWKPLLVSHLSDYANF